jgi:hypothetical protein
VKRLDWLPKFVANYLSFTGKCFRHCDKPTSLKIMSQDSTHVLGAYTCPDAFVSQVVYFTQRPDLKWFSDTIVGQVGIANFTTNDVRVATRHGWELRDDADVRLRANVGSNPTITEVYWTRYARTDAQKKTAISLCMGDDLRPGCLKLFAHESEKSERLCPACRQT